jgi:hypothetical protein
VDQGIRHLTAGILPARTKPAVG